MRLLEVRREIEQGLLETALDDYALPHVDLYSVTTGTPSRRVSALLDFLASQLQHEA